MSESQSRQRKTDVKVWVTPDEKAEIKVNAKKCSQSTSAFLRNLGQGYLPPSTLDSSHVLALAKVNGDQGRLGGLLKMWLTNDERLTPDFEKRINVLLSKIEEAETQLLEALSRL
mgnify:CR=1 FL=1